MTKIGTTLSEVGKKALLCGSGELGKEVAIELQRYGVEVVDLDKYPNASSSSFICPFDVGRSTFTGNYRGGEA